VETISIVIPVRNEAENILELRKRITSILSTESLLEYKFEIIVNDNNSSDNSVELLDAWASVDNRVKVQKFKKNMGFQQSILMGMRVSTGNAVIVLQSDLQDPVEFIEDFVQSWRAGAKVVAGIISSRRESIASRTSRNFFYWILKTLSDNEVEINFQDFYLLDKVIYDDIKNLHLSNAFIRAYITSEYGIDIRIPYVRNERTHGETKFNFAAKYSLAIDAILVYGNRIPRLLSISSSVTSLILFLISFGLLLSRLFGVDFVARGWLSLVSISLLGFSMVFFLFSILLEYLFRIYKSQLNL
jgi:glycosyltransferase involved in cell wall biosynthesis